MSSVRFADVVKSRGRPRAYLLWADPKKDRAFQAGLAGQRIMTIHQTLRGGRKDFGVVGYEPARATQFLVFPKSLRSFAGKRVIAIRYDLLRDEDQSGPAAAPSTRERKAGAASERKDRKNRGPRAGVAEVIPFAPPPAVEKPPPPNRRTRARLARLNAAAKAEIEAALGDLAKHRGAAAESRLKRLLAPEPSASG